MDEPVRSAVAVDCEVLVVGAGPTGLALGCELRRRGTDCVVVDRAMGIDSRARAVMVHAASLEWLEGLGVRGRIEEAALRMRRIAFHVLNGADYVVDFADLPTPCPYYLNVPQPEVERVLEQTYLSSGGRLLRGAEYTGHREESGYLLAEMRPADGVAVTRRIRARYLVGADGAGSAVRAHLGVDFPGTTYPMSYLLAEGVPGDGLTAPDDESAMFVGPSGAVSVLPLPEGRIRVAGPVTPELLEREEALTADAFRGAVDGLGFGSRLYMATIDRVTHYQVHERLADRFRVGRALLAGDAAHLNSPAGGQAMNTGFADAVDLAGRLETVLSGAPAALLDGYEAVRRPAAARVARSTGVAGLLQTMREATTEPERAFVRARLDGLAHEWSQLPAREVETVR
ncbi:FAD-dependent monooxygenase [Nocardiopsis alborubida]|uniref:Pentachlorophenol monooxygenase n=1 Tax=Nocardiopsis alborubida TaxID=146802 RepID=A0A7X6RSW8_9ACTN|nr:FAD-dependent monooxygenase [Nocardiopsis alborubida]NKZ01124.1 pentachlorophenol monooxygenase [Nocardiopsis alborubida]